MIKLNVSAANIAVEEKETLTEGRVGLLCQFHFTDEWTGLAKTAVFDGADSRDVILKSDTVAIPAECLSTEGYSLSVGVYGKNAAGDIVIPTVYATVGKIQRSAYPSGKETAEPTPDVVAQIQQAAANAEELARSVREDADLGKFNGGKGEKGDKGDAGEKGQTGPAGTDGGWYTPAVTQTTENTMQVVFTPSKAAMPAVDVTEITLPAGPAGSKGEKGEKGDKGADGKSAYQYAQEGGYTGTEAAFAAKLAAEKFANPNALTFTGAVTGSYDGSAPVSVEIPSGGGSSGGSAAEWQLLGTYTMLVSDRRLVIDLIQFEGITHFRIIGNFPKCSEDCGSTYIYLGTGLNHTKEPLKQQNVYAFNLLAECELVDGQLYGFIGTIDGWNFKIPANVVINTPRDSGKNTNLSIYYTKAVNDTTANTIQIWGY